MTCRKVKSGRRGLRGSPQVSSPSTGSGSVPAVVLQQAPPARALAQHRPAAVGEPAEPFQWCASRPSNAADGGADGAAVADHDQRAVLGQLVGVSENDRGGPVGDLGLQLTAAAAHGLAALPGGVLLTVLPDDLLMGEALPGTRVGLAQPRVVCDFEAGDRGELGGGGRRPLQIGGDDRVRLQRGQQPGGPLGLPDSGVGERDVRGALEPALQIPCRLAVTPEDDPAAPAASAAVQLCSPSVLPVSRACSSAFPRVLTASSGSAISGQSFQRRSSA